MTPHAPGVNAGIGARPPGSGRRASASARPRAPRRRSRRRARIALLAALPALALLASLAAPARGDGTGVELRAVAGGAVDEPARARHGLGLGVGLRASASLGRFASLYADWESLELPARKTDGAPLEHDAYGLGVELRWGVPGARLGHRLAVGLVRARTRIERAGGRRVGGWQLGTAVLVPLVGGWTLTPGLRYRSLPEEGAEGGSLALVTFDLGALFSF